MKWICMKYLSDYNVEYDFFRIYYYVNIKISR